MTREHVERLVEARQKAWAEGKAILESAETEQRSMTVEEQSAWDDISVDLDAKDAEIRSYLDAEKRTSASDAQRAELEAIFASAPKTERDDAAPSIRSIFTGESRSVTYDVPAELAKSLYARERRDVTTLVGTGGNTIPPSTMVDRLYEELINASSIFDVSTIITTASGEPLDFPVIRAAANSIDAKVLAADASLPVSEAGSLPELDPVFSKVTITPAKYGVILQVSSELATDTVVDLEGYIAKASALGIVNNASKDFVTTILAAASASGVAWANFAAVSTTGTGYTNLVDLAYAVNPQYRKNGTWLVQDAFVRNVRKLMDSQNRPVWEPSAQVGQPDTILGFPVAIDPNVPISGAASKVAVFGDLTAHTIRQVGQVRFESSSDFAFSTDLMSYRCIWRGGSAVLDTQALKSGVITA